MVEEECGVLGVLSVLGVLGVLGEEEVYLLAFLVFDKKHNNVLQFMRGRWAEMARAAQTIAPRLEGAGAESPTRRCLEATSAP